jgi:asparagine synthase (glutamine-hydrolysing)
VAGSAAPFLRQDRADVLDRAGRDGELYWGGAIAFYDAHKRALLGHDDGGSRMVSNLYADVDRALPRAGQLDRMIGIELRQRLPELLLMRVDKVTMGSSLEARVPYLDHKLVEFALAIPADVKYRNGVTKWVLKRVAERAGLDRQLIYRSKRGFCGSATNMLSPRLVARAQQDILDSEFARTRFDLQFVRTMFAEQQTGRADHNFRIWNLWNLVAWHAVWLEHAFPRPEPTLV